MVLHHQLCVSLGVGLVSLCMTSLLFVSFVVSVMFVCLLGVLIGVDVVGGRNAEVSQLSLRAKVIGSDVAGGKNAEVSQLSLLASDWSRHCWWKKC